MQYFHKITEIEISREFLLLHLKIVYSEQLLNRGQVHRMMVCELWLFSLLIGVCQPAGNL